MAFRQPQRTQRALETSDPYLLPLLDLTTSILGDLREPQGACEPL